MSDGTSTDIDLSDILIIFTLIPISRNLKISMSSRASKDVFFFILLKIINLSLG